MASTVGGIRYAPEDPNLPKPWRGLVDGKTGYVYYWNPETNVTQYERPTASFHLSSTAAQKTLSSSDPMSPPRRQNNDFDHANYSKSSNYEHPKSISGPEHYQVCASGLSLW